LQGFLHYAGGMRSSLSTTTTESTIDRLVDEAWSLRNGNATRAAQLAHQALEQAQTLRYNKGIAYSKLALAFAVFRLSQYPKALTLIDDVLALLRPQQDLTGQQRALNIRGIIYAESGDLMAALQTFLETRKLCQETNDTIGEINALNNLALVYGYLGDFSSALDAHLKSLPLIHQAGFREGEMKALVNIAVLYNQQEQYTDALEYLYKSLDFRHQNDGHAYAAALVNFSKAYMGLGKYDEALQYGFESLALLQRLEDTATSAYTLTQLGNVYLHKKEFENAETYFRKSLEIFATIGDSRGRAETKLLLAEVLLAGGQSDDALALVQRALAMSRGIGAQNETVKAYDLLAQVHKARGELGEAYDVLRQYVDIKETLASDASRQRFEALRIRFETEQTEKEKEIYRLRTVELAEVNGKLEELTQELFRQANEDPLTGLYNRRRLEQELARELERSRRGGGSLSIMICDIDNFKQVNDRFSHQMGDKVLVRVARLLKTYVRGADVVARYGGEEFVVLLPDTSPQQAYTVCDRLREEIADAPWYELHPDLRITLSMGICNDTALPDGFAMLDHADDKLYEAKRGGKNQVKI
jgi:diguanylate cyclase (GGDEF)-like protein